MSLTLLKKWESELKGSNHYRWEASLDHNHSIALRSVALDGEVLGYIYEEWGAYWSDSLFWNTEVDHYLFETMKASY